jgi:hypothetical protein
LLGGAWEEAKLLKYAFAWEQAAKPRKPPFSTPPLVNGAAPAPMTTDMAIRGRVAEIELRLDHRCAALRRDDREDAAGDRVIGLALHRSDGDKPGPIVAQLLAPNQITGSGTITMPRPESRKIWWRANCSCSSTPKQSPLGVERQRVALR